MSSPRYKRLPDSEKDCQEDSDTRVQWQSRASWRSCSTLLQLILLCALGASVIFNIVQYQQRDTRSPDHTPYTKLAYNVSRTFTLHNEFFDPDNELAMDAAWENLEIEAGTVALSDDYARSMNIPISQRFPWDKDKGIYLFGSYHNLHCLKKLYTSIRESSLGQPQSTPFEHSFHCLDSLRQTVQCHADDTPLYSGMGQPEGFVGWGQERACRDWSALQRWGRDHSACWKYVGDAEREGFDTLERYRFCPEGSEYIPVVEKFFGRG